MAHRMDKDVRPGLIESLYSMWLWFRVAIGWPPREDSND